MDRTRLEQIAQETGMSLREVERVQLDNQDYPGKIITARRKLAKKIMKYTGKVSAWAIGAAIATSAGLLSTARVSPIGYCDLNGDNIEDAVIAYPIDFTDKAVLGYVDGAGLKENEKVFRMTVLDLKLFPQVHTVENYWNLPPRKNYGKGAAFSDIDNNGSGDLRFWCGDGWHSTYNIVKDVFK